ncbi:ABC transporter substrate-binding protein [Geitlerinema sp. PCC 9228]|uniref:ABC transporter substrate-binding protein n=1 Tax=Geitlerinema sp. PCC 9228 TaxID=111611 RepID=UPI0008F9A43C|nr:ABC transporter substrate-binding protein [Geitlerinema sp. PCC 9228]
MKISLLGTLSHYKRFVAIAIAVFLTILAVKDVDVSWSPTSDRLYVAMLAPMSGDYESSGREMERGARMYLDKINQSGGIGGKQVELKIFDDEGSPEKGREQAQKIANDERIVLAMGSYFSSVSVAAGDVYQKAGLPAITGISVANEVTEQSNVYFRTTANTSDQGVLLANYIKKILNHDTVSVIFDSGDTYSQSLSRSFQNTFRGLSGRVSHKLDAKEYLNNPNRELDMVAWTDEKLLGEMQPGNIGAIVLLTQAWEAGRIVVSIKRAGIDAPIFGGSPVFQKNFREAIADYPETQAQPGYFTNGIYGLSPLIYDISSQAAQSFQDRFFTKYRDKPTWIGALSYERTMVAVQALKNAELSQPSLQEKRRSVYQALLEMRNAEQGVEGLQGKIYFDRDRNMPRILAMGRYEQEYFVSAPIQLQPIQDITTIPRVEQELEKENILRFGGQYARITHIVYTGIDINKIFQLDLRKQKYNIDFFLWFRYKESDRMDLQPETIEFLNSVNPIDLGQPLYKSKEDGIVLRTYRVKTKFEADFDFREYPFDVQQIKIQFRNPRYSREKMIYVADIAGMGGNNRESNLKRIKRSQVLDALDGWGANNVQFFESISTTHSTLGDIEKIQMDKEITYSQFNAIAELERYSFQFGISKLLPLGFFIWILYLFLWFPFKNFSTESVSGILLGVLFFHMGLKSELPENSGSIVALDIIFYIIYGLIAAQILVVLAIVKLRENPQHHQQLKRLIRSFQLIFLLYLVGAFLVISLQYDVFDLPQLPGQNGFVPAQENSPSPTIEVSTRSQQ